jgi:putative hydrolase of the HAD superfamily
MAIRAVIFDRDGVLTRFDFAPALELFKQLPGLSFDEVRQRWEQWSARTGVPRTVAAERTFLSGFWDALCDECALPDTVRERFHRFDYLETIHPFADARPALLAARARGLRIAVLSNFPLASLESSLAKAGVGDLIDVACAASVIGASKPAPAAYQYALDALGVSAEECVLIDDEPPCVEGARAVGIEAFLLDRAASAPSEGVLRDLYNFDSVLDAVDARLASGSGLRGDTSPHL